VRRWAVPAGLGVALLAAFAATAPPPLPDSAAVRAAWTPSDAALLDRHGRLLSRVRVDDSARRGAWVPLSAISPALAAAVIRAEDRRFLEHGGVDWRAVGGAVQAKLTGGRPRGASTISMQVAGLLAPEIGPAGRRGPFAKARQACAALALERGWTKAEILEAYLNLAPVRGELVGVDAAARALFGKPASGLTAPEAAAYAAFLPSPSAPRAAVAARACRTAGEADCAAAVLAVDRAVAGDPAFRDDPALAPHLARRLLSAERRAVRTTLDRDLQRSVRDVLDQRLAMLAPRNVRDAAAVVVANDSGEVLAYVGGAGDAGRSPEVDGAEAPRQAGSTLKPFLYALAIERRLLTAASVLDDRPVALETASGLYMPRSYDERFRGPVSVRTALGNSLNVPAVRALLLTGVEPFRDRLNALGYAHVVESGEYYGFSLALGSAEVTLLEQAAAFSALARGGRYMPLRLTPGPRPDAHPVMRPEAAAIIADIMADPSARSATFGPDSALDLPFFAAVKTGTSKAMRDNWAVGFSDRYTVAVWVGNFEGDSMVDVSGVTGAAPAWREIMLHLHRNGAGGRRFSPAGAGERRVLPGGVARVTVNFVPRIEPPRDELFIAGTEMREIRLATPAARRPRIVSPSNGAIVALDPDIPPGRQRVPLRVEGGPARLTINGAPHTGPFWTPVPGRHRIVLADKGGGEADAVTVVVR